MTPMAQYRAYIVGSDGHFQKVVPFVCESDEAAIEQAKQLVDGHDVELWQLDRHVAKLEANKT
jgi:hypothetical protein